MVGALTPPIVKVYYAKPMLPDASRVLVCLYEKDVEFKLINMYEGQHMTPDVIKLQASGAHAAGFEDGRTRLFESRAICRHIVDKYADRGNKYLLGKDDLERASIEQWLKLEEHSFDPPSWALVFHLAFKVEPDQALITQNERSLARILDIYEQRLGESKFLAGDEFSLADLSHLPNSHYLATSNEWSHLFESRKNVRNWWEDISSRSSWQEVVKILNKVGLLKDTVAPNRIRPLLIQKPFDMDLSTQATSTSGPSSQNHEQTVHQLQQADSAKPKTQQISTENQASSQPPNLSALSNQVQKLESQQKEENFDDESMTQQAPTSTEPSATETIHSASHKQERSIQPRSRADISTSQKTAHQTQFDAQSSNQQTRSGALPSEKEDQTRKTLPQADSGSKSTTKPGPADAPSFNVSTLSGKRHEDKPQPVQQADSSSQSTSQQTVSDTKPTSPSATPNIQPSQRREKNTKPTSQTNSADQSIAQKASTSAQSTTKAAAPGYKFGEKHDQQNTPIPQAGSSSQPNTRDEPIDTQSPSKLTTPSTPPTIKKEQKTVDQKFTTGKSIAEQAPTNANYATTSSTLGGLPSQNREQIILPAIQEDSIRQSSIQQTPSDGQQSKQSTLGGLQNKRHEKDTQTTREAYSSDPSIAQQAQTDAPASNQLAISDTSSIQKKDKISQQMNKADHDGQSTPHIDGQQSSQMGNLGALSSKNKEEDTQFIHQTDIVDRFLPQQASSNAKPATTSSPPGAPSSQKQERSMQPESQEGYNTLSSTQQAPTYSERSNQANALGALSIKKQEKSTQPLRSISKQAQSDAQASNKLADSNTSSNQKKEQTTQPIDQADHVGQSTSRFDGQQPNQESTLDAFLSNKQEQVTERLQQEDNTFQFIAQQNARNVKTPTKSSTPGDSSSQMQEQSIQPERQADSIRQSSTQQAPIDGQQSNQERNHGTLPSNKKEKGTQSVDHGDSTGHPIPQQAMVDAQSSNKSTAFVPLSNQKKEQITWQMDQADPAGKSTTHVDDEQSSETGIVGTYSSKKQEEVTQQIRQADNRSQSNPPTDSEQSNKKGQTISQEVPTDAQDYNNSVASDTLKNKKIEQTTLQMDQSDPAGQSNARVDDEQSSKASTHGAFLSNKQKEAAQQMHQGDATDQFIAQQGPIHAKPATTPSTLGAPSSQKQEQSIKPERQVDSSTQSSTQQVPVDSIQSNQESTKQTDQADPVGQSTARVDEEQSSAAAIVGTYITKKHTDFTEQIRQEDDKYQIIPQQTASNAKPTTSSSTPSAPSRQKEEQSIQPEHQIHSIGPSSTQEALTDSEQSNQEGNLDALSSKKQEKVSQPVRQADFTSKALSQQAPTDAQDSNMSVPSGQKRDQNTQQMDQAHPGNQSTTHVDDEQSSEADTVGTILSKKQEIPQQTHHADVANHFIAQGTINAKPDITSSTPSPPSQKQEPNNQPEHQADSVVQSSTQQVHADSLQSNQEGTLGALSGTKQGKGTQPVRQANSMSQPNSQQDPSDAHTQKKKKITQQMDQADLAAAHVDDIQSNEAGTLGALSSTKEEKGTQPVRQANFTDQSIYQQAPIDAQIQKKEQITQQMDQVHLAGQSTAHVDDEQSSEAGTVGTFLTKKQEEVTQQMRQEDNKDQFIPQQTSSNTNPTTISSTPGAYSRQKQEQSTPPEHQVHLHSSTQETESNNEHSNQEGNFDALTSKKEEKVNQPVRQEDSTGQAISEHNPLGAEDYNESLASDISSNEKKVQARKKMDEEDRDGQTTARIDTQQSNQAATLGALLSNKQEGDAQQIPQVDTTDRYISQQGGVNAKPATISSTHSPPSQNQDESNQPERQAGSFTQSSTQQDIVDSQQPNQASTLRALSSTEEEKIAKRVSQADPTDQSIFQQTPTDRRNQKTEHISQQMVETDLAGKSTTHVDGQQSSREGTPSTFLSKSQDQVTEEIRQAGNIDQFIAQQDDSNAKPTATSSTPSALSRQNKEKSIQGESQEDSARQSIAQQDPTDSQQLIEDIIDALPSKKHEEGTKTIHQVDSTEQQISQQAPVDVHASNKSTASDTSSNQTKEKTTQGLDQEDRGGKSKDLLDSQTGALGARLSNEREEAAQQIRRGDTTDPFIAQNSPINVKSVATSSTLGASSSQKQEQSMQPESQADSIIQSSNEQVPVDSLQSNQVDTLGDFASIKQEKGIQPVHQADSTGQSISQQTPSDVQPQKKEQTTKQMDQANPVGQSTARVDELQSSKANVVDAYITKKHEDFIEQIRQEDSTDKFIPQQTPVDSTGQSIPAPVDAQTSNKSVASDTSSIQKKEQATQKMDQEDPAGQSTVERSPTDVKYSNTEEHPPSNTGSNNSTSQTNSGEKSSSQPGSSTPPAS